MEGVEGLEFRIKLLVGRRWVGDGFAGGVEVERVLGEEVDCAHRDGWLFVGLDSCRDVVLWWMLLELARGNVWVRMEVTQQYLGYY